ncbi:MAG: DNA replication and repair protein RecF [Myxococcota bacterium]
MRIEQLVAERFRNLEPLDWAIDAQFVVLHGPNAQGKTNALEVIHLLATLKPLKARRLRELVRFGEPDARVGARVGRDGVGRTLQVDLGPPGRTARIDGKATSDLGEYFGAIRTIAFVPSDGEIVTGEPARRRSWLDRAVFTQSPAHLDRVRAVRRVLDQKSAALRDPRPDLAVLDVLDDQLARLGAELVDRRAALLAALAPHVERLHETIALGHGQLTIGLRTDAAGPDLAARTEALAAAIAAARPRELQRRTTLVGPHLDDLRIGIDHHATREFGSRGQVRSVVLAIKLAEMVAARERGLVPVFLIDDVSSELDAARTARVVGCLAELGAQVFATTTDPGPLESVLPPESTASVAVRAGVLAPGRRDR